MRSAEARSEKSEVRRDKARTMGAGRNGFHRLVFGLAVVLLLSATGLWGQTVTGVPPFSSVTPTGFDTINNANLNVMFTVPLLSKAGRGIPFNLGLTFNSSVWSNDTGGWQPVSPATSITSNWGWGISSPSVSGSTETVWAPLYCYDSQNNAHYYDTWTFWAFYDSSGTRHPMSGQIFSDQDVVAPQCRNDGINHGGPPAVPVTDGSGYQLLFTDGQLPMAVAYAPSGLGGQVWPGGWTLFPSSITAKDANGNMVSYAPYSSNPLTLLGTWKDTLGMTAVTGQSSGSYTKTYTYTGPNNTPEQITVHYASYVVATNFGCSQILEYLGYSQPFITEVDMPDIATNPGDKYMFSYEGSYAYPGAYTGRIAGVSLPTGGQLTYSYSGGSNNTGMNCDGTTATLTRTTYDNAGHSAYRTYTHGGNATDWTTTVQDPNGNQTEYSFVVDAAGNDHETQRIVNTGTSTVAATVNTCYNGSSIPCTTTLISYPITIQTVQTTLAGGFSPSQITNFYNSNGQLAETDEYGFGPSSSPLRKTVYSYTGCGVTSTYVLNRPCSVQITDGSNNLAGETDYTYYGNGDPVTEAHKTSSSSSISRSFTYSAGVLTSQMDYAGNQTNYYNFACNGAFPQNTSLPMSLSTSTSWDCNIALPISSTDVNNNPTTYSYDFLFRPLGVTHPDGGSQTWSYSNVPNVTTQVSTINSYASRQDEVVSDGFARAVTNALVNDPDGETYTGTSYDLLGRVSSVSNPYRGSPGAGDSYTYDVLNRLTKVTHTADSTYSQTSYGDSASQLCPASTYGVGYPVLYTDESQNQRQTFTDALGRLIEVEEPNSGGTLNVNTCYQYNTLGNLTTVVQGSQTRTFGYDMFSRLTKSITPEAGEVDFNYTGCSGDPTAVCQRTDAIGTTTYNYDALNRMQNASYPNNNPTQTHYTYDQTACLGLCPCYNKGRRTSMTDASGSTQWAYDSMGRILVEQRTIGSLTKTLAYSYNLDGSYSSVTYPSGRTVWYAVGAAGRPQTESDSSGNNYVQQATYAPQGALAGALLGQSGSFSGITYAATYNNRMLPSNLIATSSGGTALNLTFGYYPNGNVETITNNLNTARTQSFTYDNLNRIASGQTQPTSVPPYCWGQDYGYDRYGNLQTTTVTQCTAPALSLSINPNNNRIYGYSYDNYGDLTQDVTYSYTWDARHLLQSAAGVTYTYDGDGKRVTKSNGTLYWTFADGTPLAETNAAGTTLNEYIFFGGNRVARLDSSGNVYYYFQDQIGTTKTLANSAGAVCYDADFLPFGYEKAYVTTCSQNYKFTGLERDAETGNDHTLARMYEPNLDRWQTPDPLGVAAANPADPQTWNMYAYAHNNPLQFVDKNGEWPTSIHNMIIEKAFGGILTPDQIQILEDVSAQQDYNQSNATAYQHAMSAPGQTPEDAAVEFAGWVSYNEGVAAIRQGQFTIAGNRGFSNDALRAFGRALHSLMDSTSPAHAGFQVWDWRNPGLVQMHHQVESTINQEQLTTAVEFAQQAFSSTFCQNVYDPMQLLLWEAQQESPPSPPENPHSTSTIDGCYDMNGNPCQ